TWRVLRASENSLQPARPHQITGALPVVSVVQSSHESWRTSMPAVGDVAPDFTLKDQHGNDVTLSALRGKPVVLVFYPFTFTGVCEGELCEIRDDPSVFEGAGAAVLAISCDTRHAQAQWAE